MTPYARHHVPIDWTGDGFCEIVNANNRALYNHQGKRIGTFATPGIADEKEKHDGTVEFSCFIGDMTGDGIPDMVLITSDTVYIYKNQEGAKPEKPVPLGSEINFTLY